MLTPLWSLAARVHIKGDGSVRQLVYSDGSTDLATLSGGDGFLNSSATVHATNFVTQAGADMNTIQEMIGNLSATAASQQAELSTLSAEVQALKEFVGMTPPAGPPPAGPPALPPAGPPAMPPSPRLFTGGYGRPFGHNGRSWANLRAFAALASDGSIQAWGDSSHGGTGAPSGTAGSPPSSRLDSRSRRWRATAPSRRGVTAAMGALAPRPAPSSPPSSQLKPHSRRSRVTAPSRRGVTVAMGALAPLPAPGSPPSSRIRAHSRRWRVTAPSIRGDTAAMGALALLPALASRCLSR